MIENMEENSYFKAVVRDAIEDLQKTKSVYVFYQEQVDAVKEKIKDKIDVSFDGTFYKLKIKEKK